jgi:hypothetical protein
MRRAAAAAAFLVRLASPLLAQDSPVVAPGGSRPLIETDGTYVFQHIPHSDIIFEGQIAPRIIIKDSIGRAARDVLADESKTPVWGWQVSTTPMVRLRMFDETSNPVRTPSYMPKGTFQLARFRNLTRATDIDSAEFNRGPIEMWLVDTVPFGHHSNGQDGCLFTDETRSADEECVRLPGGQPRGVNKRDGSFSTNYIEATVHYGRMRLDSESQPAGIFATRWEWRVGAGMQFNPEGYVGGSIKPALSELYGPTRALVSASTVRRDLWRCDRAGANAKIQYITHHGADVPDVITLLEGACFPRQWGGAGLLVRFYSGQDYYNLGFDESITRLFFGVALQKDQLLSFRIRP